MTLGMPFKHSVNRFSFIVEVHTKPHRIFSRANVHLSKLLHPMLLKPDDIFNC